MEKLYQTYKDIAEFRIIYINEAHAADSSWPVPYAETLGLYEHQDIGDRCVSAEKMLEDEGVTIPTLIDNMDNSVNKTYNAWPDRVYVVKPDGTLAVAADQGPHGFKPALDDSRGWLIEYHRSLGEDDN